MSRAEFETSVMSRALSAGKGLGSGPVLTIMASPTRTSNTPLRGFSALMMTSTSSITASMAVATFDARVLNADQLLHASIEMGGYAEAAPAELPKGAGAWGGAALLVLRRSTNSAFLPEMGKPAARNFSLSSTTVQRERSSTDDIFTMERGQCAAPCRRAAAEASPNARSIVKSPI